MIGKEIARMNQQLLAHVHIQVFPNLRQQNWRVGNDEGNQDCNVEESRCFAGRLPRFTFAYVEVVVIKGVQAEVVGEVFGRKQKPKGNTAEQIVSFSERNVPRVGLLRSQVKVEREQHEENEQRVFLAYAIENDGVYAASPERGRYQSGPAIEESRGQKEQRDYC